MSAIPTQPNALVEERSHVVALCGSRREDSYTHRALTEALEGAEDAGTTTEMVALADYDLPPFDPDNDNVNDSNEVRDKIRNADAVILGTPMYHGSYSGVLKNTLDYCGFDEDGFSDENFQERGVNVVEHSSIESIAARPDQRQVA